MPESSSSPKPTLRLPENPAIEAYKDQNRWAHLIEISVGLTPKRKLIVESLMTRPWFQRTSKELQLELAQLPQQGRENHDGFLADLAGRPDKMGGIEVLELAKLPRGNFALIPTFKVKNEKGDEYTYEYVSWRYGPNSGAKGIVFIENGGKISHFVVLRGEKFATGQKESDSVGGFIDLNVDGIKTVLQRIDREIKEELGVSDLKIKAVYDLGEVLPDAGMTNNKPRIFAAVINADEAQRVSGSPLNLDKYELRAGVVIIPISQLGKTTTINNDSFFLSAVARSAAYGIIDVKHLRNSSQA
ncbi:MAG: hypothetical protein Q7R31_04870 [Candidatus Levybacteria bacterium]|nr:hypothetical protein [Candidatus Levybacteria bacterium]